MSLAGAEVGVGPNFCNSNPGKFGKAYTYNSERCFAYFAEQGITLFRVPFRWERMQPRLGQPLDRAELRDKFLLLTRHCTADASEMFDRLQNLEREPALDWIAVRPL